MAYIGMAYIVIAYIAMAYTGLELRPSARRPACACVHVHEHARREYMAAF